MNTNVNRCTQNSNNHNKTKDNSDAVLLGLINLYQSSLCDELCKGQVVY